MAKLIYDKTGRLLFTKDMKKEYTLLMPQMLPISFTMMKKVFELEGYKVDMLNTTHRAIVDTGLRYVHNDACYPAVLVIGQLLDAVNSGKYDKHKVGLLITQTGGGCRASNYIHLLRKALERAGMEYIPVVSVNLSGLEKNPGFGLNLRLIRRLASAMIYGDLLMWLRNQCLPYEVTPGVSDKLTDHWTDRLVTMFEQGRGMGKKEMRRVMAQIVTDYAKIERRVTDKPRVGIVGEIYVKFSPLGNNNLEEFLLSEGCEPVVPGLTDFMIFKVNNRVVDVDLYKGSKLKKLVCSILQRYLEGLQQIMIEAVKTEPSFRPMGSFKDLQALRAISATATRWARVAAHGGDARAHPHQHAHRLHAALRLPAEPRRRQGHDPPIKGRLPRVQHRRHRLRPRRDENQPGKPHQAHDSGRAPHRGAERGALIARRARRSRGRARKGGGAYIKRARHTDC